MKRFDLLSKRKRDQERAGQEDVYVYDQVPAPFRVQFLKIASNTFGQDNPRHQYKGLVENPHWQWVSETYSYEKGISPIGGFSSIATNVRIAYHKMNYEDALDLTDLIGYKLHEYGSGAVIDEVNYRLREAGMGYQVENGRLTRVDSQLIHQEVVKPALALIAAPGFEGVEQEFLSAHSHYRAGKYKEAVGMAANAVESTLKAIFERNGWKYQPTGRISDLLKIARLNKLWPDYLDGSFDQLAATLQSGLPQIRDKSAAHGQGAVPIAVSAYLAAYALHLSATNIVFLVAAANEAPS